MTICRHVFHKLAFSTFLLTIPLQAVHAQDATAVADRLKALATAQGVDLAWTNVTGDASEIVLEGVTVKPTAEKDPLPIGNVTLSGVTEEGGGYNIETLTTSPFSKTQDGMTLDIGAIVMNGMHVPAEGNTDPMASFMTSQSAELATVSVKIADKTALAIEGWSVEMTPPADGKAMEFTGSAEKFTADLTLVEDVQSKAVIDALGYRTINGSFELAGSWQPTDGRMTLSQYDITVEDAGTLGFTFDFGGYTPAFIQSLQDMQKKMAEQPEGADNSAQGLAMLGLMQQLTFHTANIRFDDESLTGKVLDYVAKQQNMTPQDIANQAKAIVPFLTAQLNNPELSAQITAAVTEYLDDPQSIEIDATPAAPVPFALVAAGGMSNPMELPKTLGVTVTANDDSE